MKRKEIAEVLRRMDYAIKCYSTKVTTMDYEDAQQEVRLRIAKSYKKYNKKYAENTYFIPVIKNEVARLKKISNKKRYNESCVVAGYKTGNVSYFNRQIIGFIHFAKYKLSEFHQQIALDLIDGLSLTEIAKNKKISISNVYNIKKDKIWPVVEEYMQIDKMLYPLY